MSGKDDFAILVKLSQAESDAQRYKKKLLTKAGWRGIIKKLSEREGRGEHLENYIVQERRKKKRVNLEAETRKGRKRRKEFEKLSEEKVSERRS